MIPDLAAYGKTISGGLPLAAVCGRADLLDCADPGRRGQRDYAFVSGTFNGSPLGAAAGLATLEALSDPGVYDRLRQTGGRLRDGLEDAGRSAGLPLRVIGDGPVLQPFFAEGPLRNHHDTLAADASAAAAFGTAMVEEGIFVNPGGKIYISLAHSEEDVDRAVAAAERALERVQYKGSAAGPS